MVLFSLKVFIKYIQNYTHELVKKNDSKLEQVGMGS